MNSTYVIGLILLAAIVLPIALLNHKKGKKNAIIKAQFTEMTKSATIANHEFWNGYLIAIDEIEKKCFYIHQEDASCKSQIIDLTQFSSCRVVSSSTLGISSSTTEMIALVFTPKATNAESKTLQFFNADTDGFTLNGELQTAERWKKICNDCMNNKK